MYGIFTVPTFTKFKPKVGDDLLFGDFNPSEKYLSNWKSSPNRGEQKHIFETTTQTSYVRSSKCKIYCKAGRQNVPIYLWGNFPIEDGQYLSKFQDDSYTSVIVPTLKPTSQSTRKPGKKKEVSSSNSPFFSHPYSCNLFQTTVAYVAYQNQWPPEHNALQLSVFPTICHSQQSVYAGAQKSFSEKCTLMMGI